jgi:hypothetical protein
MGETLRGTLNSSVDKRFSAGSESAQAKNQAAIEAGRFERHNHQFYSPDDVGRQYGVPASQKGPAPASSEWNTHDGGAGEQRTGGRLGQFINRASRPLSGGDEYEQEPRPRKLRKRSSSRLGVVPEVVQE